MALGILPPGKPTKADEEALKKLCDKIIQIRREQLEACGDKPRVKDLTIRVGALRKESALARWANHSLVRELCKFELLWPRLVCNNIKIYKEWMAYHEGSSRPESYKRMTQEKITERATNRKNDLNSLGQEDVLFFYDHLVPPRTHNPEVITIEEDTPQQQPTPVSKEPACSIESPQENNISQESTSSVAAGSTPAQSALDIDSDSEDSLFGRDDDDELGTDSNAPAEISHGESVAPQLTNLQPEVLPGVEGASQDVADFALDNLPGFEAGSQLFDGYDGNTGADQNSSQFFEHVELGHGTDLFGEVQYADFGNSSNASVNFDYSAGEMEADLAKFFGNDETNQDQDDACLAILQEWEQAQQFTQEPQPIQGQQATQAPGPAAPPMDFAAFQRSQNMQQALQSQPVSDQESNAVAQPSYFLAGQWTQSRAAPPIGRQIDILSSTRNGYQRRVSNQKTAEGTNGESTAAVQDTSQEHNSQPPNTIQAVQVEGSSSATLTPSPLKRKRPGRPPKNGPDYVRKRKLQGEYGPDEYRQSEGKDRYSPRKKSCTGTGNNGGAASEFQAHVHYAPSPQAALGLNTSAEQYVQGQQQRTTQRRPGAAKTTNAAPRGRKGKKAVQMVPGPAVIDLSEEAASPNAMQQQHHPQLMPHFQQQPAPIQPANMQIPQQTQTQAVPAHPMYTAPSPQLHQQQPQQNHRKQPVNGLMQLNLVLQQTLNNNNGALQAYYEAGIPEGDALVTGMLQQNAELQNRINNNNQMINKMNNPYFQGS